MTHQNIATSSTVTTKTEQGCTITVERVADVSKGNKSRSEKKADDESRGIQVVQAEVHRKPEPSAIVIMDTEESENENESV